MEKNPKLINVGPTFIPDYRVTKSSTQLLIENARGVRPISNESPECLVSEKNVERCEKR